MTHPTAQVAPRPAVPIAPAFPIRLGILLAIAVGWLEILIRFAIHLIRGHPIDVGPHVLWMTPVANLLWFGVTGLALALAARLWPRLARPALVLGLLAFPAILSLLLLNTKFFDSANVVLAAGLAVQAGTLGARHLPALERLARRGAVMAVALLAAATLGLLGWLAGRERWALAHLPSARDGAPNVLLIVLDTVRDFNVSLAGYERRTTPALERWAAEGVHFEHAFAPAPWTLPSHATMFTGRWPHELTTTLKTPLDDRYPTLAEALRAAGYATGGFAANLSYVTWQFGLDRGFLHFEDFPVTKRTLFVASSLGRWLWAHGTVRRLAGDYDLPDRKSAAMVGDGFLGWQASLGRRPFFAFLNLFDAHFPYLPPAPYDTLFGPRPAPIFRGEELKFGDLTPTET
ncbi:MAG TPA: sulfatase-like hydrolase/transferase, partial [Gemmatimonadaceae bacterium]|nr:sulfatase-like hydrolase/transferase [Gemmatimonadaceae bacterium]